MRRSPVLSLVLTLTLGLWLSGCGGETGPATGSDSATTPDIATTWTPDSAAADGSVTPGDTAEATPDTAIVDHGFGDPCETGDDCYSGVCVEHMGSTVCTKGCDDDCPAGWACEQVSAHFLAGGEAEIVVLALTLATPVVAQEATPRLAAIDAAQALPADEWLKRSGFEEAEAIASDLLEMFEAGKFDVAHLVYPIFKSALAQDPTTQQLIPVPASEGDAAATKGGDALVEYEPGEEEILEVLLPRYVRTQLFGALLEREASEQGASMTAMDNATRNAGDLIKDLNIEYNRSRQAAITTELIEIIAGAEAL